MKESATFIQKQLSLEVCFTADSLIVFGKKKNISMLLFGIVRKMNFVLLKSAKLK